MTYSKFARLIVALCATVGMGCEDPQDNEPPPDQPAVNTDAPTGNARLLGQEAWGAANEYSRIVYMQPLADGWVYAGYDDGWFCIGALSANGTVQWIRRTGYRVCDLAVLEPGTGPVPNGIVAIGKLDADGDGWSDEARIALLDPAAGQLLAEQPVLRADADIWFNALSDPLSEGGGARFVAFGAIDTSAAAVQFCPYACRFTVTSDSTIEVGDDVALWSQTGDLVLTAASNRGSSQGGYVLGAHAYANDSTVTGAVVLKLGESLGLEWRTPIVAQGGYVTETSMGESLVRAGGSIYLAGTSDVPKEDGPAGGGYWNAGLLASLDETGAVRWTRLVTVTAHSERFRALFAVGSRLYAAGSGADYNIVSTGEMFGYGLLSAVESATGLEVASWTLGDEHLQSGFNGVWADATRAIAGGWTGCRQNGGPCQAWYAQIDVADSLVAGAVLPVDTRLPQALAGARDLAAVRADRQRLADEAR